MREIAIVGIGCHLPGGVRSPADLWHLLLSQGDGMVDIPPERWSLERFYDPDPEVPGRLYTRRGGFLQASLEEFDPEFFGISPREAAIMDPQQRLLLEVTQEALDDAGHASRVGGRAVGVYVGGFTADNMAARHNEATRRAISMHTPTSSSYTMLSNRLSFAFDLRGPSMTLDTACSSSLVALHQAVAALQRDEIEMALVGGVNAMLRPETFISMCKGHFLAPDGRCKTFDKAADGYARGEGAAMLVLRPLQAAQADGDRIYAVVRATGCNQDGRTPGITVPCEQAQAELIGQVTARAGLAPAEIGYVEAHGTGTSVGDPIEMAAIGRVLGAVAGRQTPLRVGSIKSSIGHTEAAAGVASVIKAALTLYHRTVPPQAGLNELNPAIPFDDYRLQVPRAAEPFPAGYARPAASVNGFGYGGTNAHAVLVAAPNAPSTEALTTPPCRARSPLARICPVSGRNEPGARAYALALAEAVAALGNTDEVDAWVDALWTRRLHHPCRFAVPYADRDELLARLRELGQGGGKAPVRVLPQQDGPPGLVFVLSGMGPQWWGMARGLLTSDGPFAQVAREIDAIFRPLAGWSLIDELLRDEAESRASSTRVAQTGNFLVQVGLAAELAALGIRPTALVGHSVGEVSAAYLSGMLSLREAVTVSYHRARLQAQQAGTGSMLAVGLPEAVVQARITHLLGVEIAAVNSPTGVTLAGATAPLQQLAAEFEQEGVFNRLLQVEVPYHSHLMDPILPPLRDALAGLNPQAPHLPLYSTVTGQRVNADAAPGLWDADYWAANVRQPVHFAAALDCLVSDGHRAFLELGPHAVLSGNVREMLSRRGEPGASVPTLVRQQADDASLRATLAELYALGLLSDSAPPGGLLGPVPQRELPVHRFQRVPLWAEVPDLRRDRLGDTGAPVLPGLRTRASQPEWECDVSVGALPWLREHVVAGLVLLPGAAYLDAALAAAVAITGREHPALEDVVFVSPLIVGEHEAPVLRLSVDEDTRRFTVRSRLNDDSDWVVHARGRIVDARVNPPEVHPVAAPDLTPEAAQNTRHIDGPRLYEQLQAAGLSYGPQFQRIQRATVTGDCVEAQVDGRLSQQRHQAHPAVLDCALQCMAAWASAARQTSDADTAAASGPLVPAAVQAVRQYGPLPEQLHVRVTRLAPRPDEAALVAHITLSGPDGRCAMELARVQCRPITPRQALLDELQPHWYEWVDTPLETPPDTPVDRAADDAPAPQLFIVGLGHDSRNWVRALEATHPANRSVTAQGGDPEAIAEAVAPRLRSMLSETTGTVTVVVCATPAPRPAGAAGAADGADGAAADGFDLGLAMAGPATLAGVAMAVQEVLAELEETQVHLPLVQGLVLTQDCPMAATAPGSVPPQLSLATLVGARRTLRNENSALRWRWLDVDAQATPANVLAALHTMTQGSTEIDELKLHAGQALAPQLQRTLAQRRAQGAQGRVLPSPEANFAIELPASRLLADLALRELPRRAPEAGEVELRLEALELNYKDAMKAIGLLSEKELGGTYFGMSLGMSGVGVVTRVGAGVQRLQLGDTVVFGTRGMAQRYVTTGLDHGFFMAIAAGTPVTELGAMVPFLTAHYSVVHAARVQAGEVVLVHGGAGGVGMAAIQAARAAGATVIATASTPERQAVARQMGAEFTLDSRSLNFVEQVRQLTGGRGADVVISSAPGEILAANLQVAAEFGRVVEVGKLDIFTNRPLALAAFEKNLSLHAIDIDRMSAFRPGLVQQLQTEVLGQLAAGHYRPLPGELIPVSRMAEAFEKVQRSAHVGRVLLGFDDTTALVRPALPSTRIEAQASYLITGGFGAFGLATARWLAARGARHLVLVGRSGATLPAQTQAVAALQAQGVEVISRQLDITRPDEVLALLQSMQSGEARLPPLRGVFHTAGVIQDGPFSTLSEQALQAVLAPKAQGAFNLHRALQQAGITVDWFVLFSSVAAITGTVPQTAYAAANAALDALAQHRRSLGLAATAVNWGALSGGGMAEASDEVARYLALMGFKTTPMERACEYLDAALALQATQPVICEIDWDSWGRAHAASASVRRFAELVSAARAGSRAGNEVMAQLAALPAEARVQALSELLAGHIASVMGIPAESVDRQTPLPELGMDSLMAVELNLRVTTALGVEVPALEFTRGGGLNALAARLLRRMEEAAARAG
ncbi:type I polyketide synthase [Curvibacter gracilis]|uniref:type I polyketide synthase n=1 Tax=Curvibacter gracilis TaxID=230310 RepID=UPI0004829D47|nr:type I polyketide synthase [Curvibacter gracilis]